jgi:hypothetical protein
MRHCCEEPAIGRKFARTDRKQRGSLATALQVSPWSPLSVDLLQGYISVFFIAHPVASPHSTGRFHEHCVLDLMFFSLNFFVCTSGA